MKCAKCGFECDDGTKFCDECGAELPQVKSCPKCHAQLSVVAKFCDACGYDFSNKQKDGEAAISMGDKNVVAGDVVAHKESFKISGNATIVKNEDASKKMVQCTICGKNIPISESFECQDCHQIVCEVCFDKMAKKCKKCDGAGQGKNEETYRAAIAEALSDGKIDVSDRKKLMALQKQLGISVAKAVQIEKEMKPASGAGESKNSAAFDKANTDKAYQLLYVKGDYKKAAELIAPVCERHPEDENALSIYLGALARFNPIKARAIVAQLHADVLCGTLALIDIDIKNRNFASVEKRIEGALAIWPDNALLKCRKAVYACELFKATEDSAPLMGALADIETIDETNDAVVKSWKFYAKKLVDSALGEAVKPLDYNQCSSEGLLWDVVSADRDKSALQYRIIDVSAGPEAKHYPTYYMDTESIKDWTDEFKTDLIVLRKVSPNTFSMGHGKNEFPSYESSEGFYLPEIQNPEHPVTLSKAYYIGVFPITQKQWELITGCRPSQFKAEPYYASRAIDCVRFTDLRGSSVGLKWPNSKGVDSNSVIGILRKRTGFLVDLPTEAQWECACRAGTSSDFYSGENLSEDAGENIEVLKRLARFDANHYVYDNDDDDPCERCTGEKNGPAKVGMYSPNAWGLYDFYGNVSEWCLEPFFVRAKDARGFYRIDEKHVVDPVGWGGDEFTEMDASNHRISRGGDWFSEDPNVMTSWAREGRRPDCNQCCGARLVINVDVSLSERWSKATDAELLEIPVEDVNALMKSIEVGDFNAELLVARCRWLGVGGLKKSTELAESSMRSLIAQGFPAASTSLAKLLMAQAQNEADEELIGEALALYRDAIRMGDLGAVRDYKNLLRAEGPFLDSLVATCSKIVEDPRNEFTVLVGDKLGKYVDAMWKTASRFLGWSEDMRPNNIVAALVSASRGEVDRDSVESDNASHFAMLSDEGIILIQGYGWGGSAQYHSGYLSWLDFVKNGDVRRFGYNDLYLKLVNDSMVMEVACQDDNKVKAYADILACARLSYKWPAACAPSSPSGNQKDVNLKTDLAAPLMDDCSSPSHPDHSLAVTEDLGHEHISNDSDEDSLLRTHYCKLEISSILVKLGSEKYPSLKALEQVDRSALRNPLKFKSHDESVVLDSAIMKLFVDGKQILCEELDPDNDESEIAYEDDGELFTEGLNVEGDEVLLFVQKSCKRTRLSEFEIAGDFVPAKLQVVYRTFSHTSEDDMRIIWSILYDGKNVGRKFVGDAADSDKKSWIEGEDEYGEFDVWSNPVSENLTSAPIPSVSENDAAPEEAETCDGHVSDRKRILFFIIGILFGFLGFHFKYAHRRILFHLTWLLLVATGVCMAMKKEMIGAGLGAVWFILWIGCAFFMKKDGSGRKMNWFKSIK